jgi:hypothetical protein
VHFKHIPLSQLVVNPDNDRHGHQKSEQDAVNWLFENHGAYMMNLIEDVASLGEILDPPLAVKAGREYIVFDGNRRVTSLKALAGLVQLPKQFDNRISQFQKKFRPDGSFLVGCQIETRPEIVDRILSRRHNGTDAGRGQLSWDPRAKANNAARIGGTQYYEISAAVENYLESIGYKLDKKFKRSTVYRLLNTKKRQERFGIKLGNDGSLIFERPEEEARAALIKVVDDTLSGDLTLKHLLNLDGINGYLDKISDLLLPVGQVLTEPSSVTGKIKKDGVEQRRSVRQQQRETLIPNYTSYSENFKREGLGKIERIWGELQFKLKFDSHPIAIASLLRALIETVTYFGLTATGNKRTSSLSGSVKLMADVLMKNGLLDPKVGGDVQRFANDNNSHRCLEVLQRAVHSPALSLGKEDLLAIWDVVEPYLTAALKAKLENGTS